MADTPTPMEPDWTPERRARLEALLEKRAPVQGFPAGIPWSMHLRAYEAYTKKWSPQPALIEGGCRGGFGTGELDMFIPGWRDQLGAIEHTKDLDDIRACLAEITRLTADCARKDSAILKAKFTGYPAHGTGFVTGYDDIYAIQQELRAAASARGEGK